MAKIANKEFANTNEQNEIVEDFKNNLSTYMAKEYIMLTIVGVGKPKLNQGRLQLTEKEASPDLI